MDSYNDYRCNRLVSNYILLKANRLLAENEIEDYGDGLFRVKGSEDRQVEFMDGSSVSCSCDWWVRRRQQCSHMIAVELYMESKNK